MNLNFNTNIASDYHSNAQIARILTEAWVEENMYCPRCGNNQVKHFPNNKPVADFYCPICNSEYELKSKASSLAHKVNDGAYETMVARITSNKNPDFFFMNYSKENLRVRDLIFIPKHFFVPEIIEKRKPLSEKARRAGWIGCNILIDKIPEQGKISIISNGIIEKKSEVTNKVKKCVGLTTNDIHARSWIMDVLNCVNQQRCDFSLSSIYEFETELSRRHPGNNNIQAKIRQQLQVLRDKGYIEFLGQGKYRKL